MSASKFILALIVAVLCHTALARSPHGEEYYQNPGNEDQELFFRNARILTGAEDSAFFENGAENDEEEEERLQGGRQGKMLLERVGGRTVVRDSRNFVGMNWFEVEEEVPPRECQATNGALNTGTCFSSSGCDVAGGVASGGCDGGGVCCIFPTVCGGTVTRNRTWFVNKDFPDYTREPNNCELTIRRLDPRIKQARLELTVSELGDAVQGLCLRDALTVTRGSSNVDLIPPLCGDNSGQHVYVDFAYQDLKLRIKTSTRQRRKWHVLISQVAPGNEIPSGCLQYHTDRSSTVKSLNFNSGSYLFRGDLDYDVCFPKLDAKELRAGCERRTEDIDLRQSENDVRTRRRTIGKFFTRGSNRRSRSAKLPIVMAFDNIREQERYKSRSSNNQMQMNPSSRSMPPGYSLVSDPVYSQIGEVMGQLQPTTSTGLESLLQSRSQLDQMKEEFSQRAGLPEDTYYYYYYDDEEDKNFVSNDINDVTNEPATDNYAVEHSRHEVMVLPDGSPLPTSYIVRTKNSENKATESSSSKDKYFHLGMIKNLEKQIEEQEEEQEADPKYPTPLYYEPATSAPINLLKPEYPVASVVMYDPMTYGPDDPIFQGFEKPTTLVKSQHVSNKKTSPTQIGLNDLTTLSSIDPDDEYTLKHDGVRWIFLKNEEVKTTPSPTVLSTTSRVILPHDIKISPGKVEPQESILSKPHLVFKHPSGTVTEMHINSANNGNSKEKIITVIETGPVTQNYTKIKINDITELDKVIENVFNIVSESSEKYESKDGDSIISETFSSRPSTTRIPTETVSPSKTAFSLHSKNTVQPDSNFASTAIDNSQTRSSTNDRISTKPIPTRIIQRISSIPAKPSITVLTNPPKVTRRKESIPTKRPQVIRVTKIPPLTTRYTKPPVVTRFPSTPVTNRVTQTTGTTRYTKKPEVIKVTTPILDPTRSTTVKVTKRPTIRYTTTQVRPGLKRVTVSAPPGTVIPDKIREALEAQSVRPEPVTTQVVEEVEEMEEETSQPTQSSTSPFTEIFQGEEVSLNDPFATMIYELQAQVPEVEPEPEPVIVPETTKNPLFTISTTSGGVVSTKSYATVEDALEDLKQITTASVRGSSDIGSDSTYPYSRPYSTRTTPLTSVPTVMTSEAFTEENLVDAVTIYNNDICEDSFIKVNDVKVCDSLIRSEPIRDEAQRLFKDMERISVRSLGVSNSPLRFSLKYDTVCPVEEAQAKAQTDTTIRVAGYGQTTDSTPQVKTINLLQYLLGWYR
ncbi:CUB domain [Trinorchestia longiramus]|nr:CUB domain [Trinorchestia longiramus]